jgi:hypothetical protein
MVESGRMKWVKHVADMRDITILVGKLEGERSKLGADGKIILKRILGKPGWKVSSEFVLLRFKTVVGLLWTR